MLSVRTAVQVKILTQKQRQDLQAQIPQGYTEPHLSAHCCWTTPSTALSVRSSKYPILSNRSVREHLNHKRAGNLPLLNRLMRCPHQQGCAGYWLPPAACQESKHTTLWLCACSLCTRVQPRISVVPRHQSMPSPLSSHALRLTICIKCLAPPAHCHSTQ